MKFKLFTKLSTNILFIQSSFSEVNAFYKKFFSIPLDASNVGFVQYFTKGENNLIVCWCRDYTASTVAHECLHVIDKIYDRIKQPVNYEETTCYLLSELIDEFYTLKKDKNKSTATLIRMLNK